MATLSRDGIRVAIDTGQFQAAITELHEQVKVDPSNAMLHYDLGYCHYRLADLRSAGREFEEALALDSRLANAAYYLGEIEMREGRRNSARNHFEQALSSYPSHKGAEEMLASLQTTPPRQSEAPERIVEAEGRPESLGGQRSAVASAFMRALMTDPNPASREAVGLIRALAMDVRPRFAPYIFPRLLILGVVIAVYVAAMLVLNGRQNDPTFSVGSHVTALDMFGTDSIDAAQQVYVDNANAFADQEARAFQMGKLEGVMNIAGGIAVVLGALLFFSILVTLWLVSLKRYTFSDGRVRITKGFFRQKRNIELYRAIDAQCHETLLTKLTGDGYLTITYEQAGKENVATLLGLAKYGRLSEITDQLRELLPLLRTGATGKGIIY